MAISLDHDFYNYEVNTQLVSIVEEDDHIQILCNDPEEREHVMHILMDYNTVLCVEME